MKLPEWLECLTNSSKSATLVLQAPIGGSNGITGETFGKALLNFKPEQDLELHLNTLGGSIPEGIAIANMIRARGNVTTRVIGYAASMGAIIHQAGAKRQMMPGTMLVVHNPQASTDGDVSDHEQSINLLKSAKANLVNLLSERTGNGKMMISKMMDDVTSIGPEEAVELGFCDEIVTGTPIKNKVEPDELCALLRNGAPPGHEFYGNQHTGSEGDAASDSAMQAGEHAARASNAAYKARHDFSLHRDAAQKNREAAEAHRKASEKNSGTRSAFHKEQADFHQRMADSHSNLDEKYDRPFYHRLASKNNLSQQPIGADGTAEGETNQRKNDSMSKLIGTLARFKLVNSADLNDEQASPQAEANISAIVTERDGLKANVSTLTNQVTTLTVERDSLSEEVKTHREALKARVTNKVTKAIEAKLVKPERKDALIAAGLSNEAALDFIDDLQPARRSGAAPLPPEGEEGGNEGNEAKIASLRNKINSGELTLDESAKACRELRQLRGHGDLLKYQKEEQK